MKKIFTVNGPPGSGKTLFGQIVDKKLTLLGINFIHESSINPVKMVLGPVENWDKSLLEKQMKQKLIGMKRMVVGDENWDGDTKNEFWRKAMSDLKLRMTESDPDLIHSIVLEKIRKRVKDPYVAFVDIREPENIRAFLKFVREEEAGISTATIFIKSDASTEADNYSDKSIYNMKYDIVIDNDHLGIEGDMSLKELEKKADLFIASQILNNHHKERV